MMTRTDRPNAPGDLVLVNLEPALGTEQRGTRPAIVISTIEMNTLTKRVAIRNPFDCFAMRISASLRRRTGCVIPCPNESSGNGIICPITNNTRYWPSKVLLPEGLAARGAILVDQVRSIDRNARILRFIGTVPDIVLAEVRAKLAALVGIPFIPYEERGDEA